MQFRVKICGITSVADAEAAVEAGADAIGLNFFSGSRRHIQIAEAQRISAALRSETHRVAVFVNASAEEIRQIGRDVSIHLIQLHGDEPPAFLGQLNRDFDIIRARRLDDRGTAAIAEDIKACCEQAGMGPDAILVDAAAVGQFGGTGHTLDWKQLADHRAWSGTYPLILAGGLTPENVAEAIRIVRPQAVDVASGVESSQGKKDRAKLRDFIAAARAAFSNLPAQL
jgi:phosphoribosylanthranilate isomerase